MTAPEQPVVVVSAVGVASAVPDAVVLHLSVEVVDDEPGVAVSRVAALVDDLLRLLDAEGVAAADRRTTGLSVDPHWDQRDEGPRGHQAQYSLQAVARDVGTAAALVQRAADTAGGALRVHSFQLTVRDPAPHRAAARADAVRACREQAGQLAEAAGVRLGRLLRLVEGGEQRYAVMESASGRAAGPGIEQGTQEVAVGVTATYALD